MNYPVESWFVDPAAQGQAGRVQQPDSLASAACGHPPLRRLAGQQPRLGAVPASLLGTPLPIWSTLTSLTTSSSSVRLPSCGNMRAIRYRTTTASICTSRRSTKSPGPPPMAAPCGACRKSSTSGSIRRHVVRPVALSVREQEIFEANFPADFICKGVDQTGGWFYSLHAIGTLIKDSPAYKNIIVNGLLLYANGEDVQIATRSTRSRPWTTWRRRDGLVHAVQQPALGQYKYADRGLRESRTRCSARWKSLFVFRDLRQH